MPKLYDLTSLKDILPPSENPHYFLFMLGTDTEFTPRPTKQAADISKRYYENGETLSYIAQLIAQQLGEVATETPPNQHIPYHTHSVAVINGPTTLGSEVGERVAQAVFLILKELCKGKETIQISAHSRGAVETILIRHELDRIQKEITEDPTKSIYKILINSPCPFTKTAFLNNASEANEAQDTRIKLASRLKTAKINLFLIDPVPGGRFKGIPYTAWRDPRFYLPIPDSTTELILMRHERSRCFIPIVPNGIQPLSVPGHHGTASGNLYSQQYEALPAALEKRDTSTVQRLILCKILNFIHKQTKIFNARQRPIELRHPELDPLANQFISASPKERIKILLELYSNTHSNNSAYEHFINTSYPYLGTEKTDLRHRFIHFRAHNYVGLDSVVPGLDGEFVNTEHAHLYLDHVMDFSIDNESDLMISMDHLIVSLNNLFIGYQNNDSKIKTLLNQPITRQNTFQALSLFVDSLSQRYLRNHLTIDIKTRLLQKLNQLFFAMSSCKRIPDEDPINTIINECKAILCTGVKKTAETHYFSLIEQSNLLSDQFEHLVAADKPPKLGPFLEDNSPDDNELLINLNQLHGSITDLIDGSPHIRNLVGSLNLHVDQTHLHMHRERTLQLAAKFLVFKKINLRVKPEGLSNEFFNLIKPLAIAYGANDPVKEDLIAENQSKQTIIQKLVSPKEVACAHLIENKLIPLTKNYLLRLTNDSYKINPRNDRVSIYENLPPINDSHSTFNKQAYEKINRKYIAVQCLLKTLEDKDTHLLPSTRVQQFMRILAHENQQLHSHHHPMWYQYVKNCMIAIGIVCTGVLPGVIALLTYTYLTDKSSPLFFTKSQGEEYTNKIQQVLSPLTLTHE